MFSLFNFHPFFQGVSWPHLPLCADARGSVVCVHVSVGHSHEPYKNGWTDRGAVRVMDSDLRARVGPKNCALDGGGPDPPGKGQPFWGTSLSPLWSIAISGVSLCYSVDGSSDASFRCRHCSNLLLLVRRYLFNVNSTEVRSSGVARNFWQGVRASICSIPFCPFPFSCPPKSAVQSKNVMTYHTAWMSERTMINSQNSNRHHIQ